MRKFFAILQLLLLSLPTFASVSTLHGDEANLPACCRRAGAHHCMMKATQASANQAGIGISSVPQRCPYCPKAMPAAQHAPAPLVPSALIYAEIVSHPASSAQTLAKFRIARDRSRQKRGPPASLNC